MWRQDNLWEKKYTVKKVIDTKHVLLSGLISTKPENLKHLKYSNEYDRVEIIWNERSTSTGNSSHNWLNEIALL